MIVVTPIVAPWRHPCDVLLTFARTETLSPAEQDVFQVSCRDHAPTCRVVAFKRLDDLLWNLLLLRVLVHHVQKLGKRHLTACGEMKQW